MWACAAGAPFAAVLLVMHGAVATAAAALASTLLALLVLFFVLPFDAIASVCVAVASWRKILYALVPHWHAISWQHSPALWRHRVALTNNAEALSRHAGTACCGSFVLPPVVLAFLFSHIIVNVSLRFTSFLVHFSHFALTFRLPFVLTFRSHLRSHIFAQGISSRTARRYSAPIGWRRWCRCSRSCCRISSPSRSVSSPFANSCLELTPTCNVRRTYNNPNFCVRSQDIF